MNEEFSRERFAGALGSKFTLHAAEEKSVEIELIEVSEARERPNQVSFSIVFLLPEFYNAEQGLYDLTHDELGAFQIFLVPIGSGKRGAMLEAVFNFLRTEPAETNG